MAELIVSKDELGTSKSMSVGLEAALKTELTSSGSDEVVFALVVIDRKPNITLPSKPTAPGDYQIHLLVGSNRYLDKPDWRAPHTQRSFPGNTPVNPQPAAGARKAEVFAISYPDDEYIGFCTVIGGRPIWF
jgi:hypothetical protein